jgi:MerR family transcriptional regulator, heat shock protein HspR
MMIVDGQLDEPRYIISVAARLVDLHPQTLRHYESIGLVNPRRSGGNIRLYSQRDIDRVRKIARLMDDLGVNLAGVEIILNMGERLEQCQGRLDSLQKDLRAEMDQTRSRMREQVLQVIHEHMNGRDSEWQTLAKDLEGKL